MVSNGKVAPVPTKMPKHIQMGTGFRTLPAPHCTSAATVLPPASVGTQKPDLLSEAAHNVSRSSVNTTTTTSLGKPDSSTSSNHSHGSYKMAMENIIEDYVDGRYYFIYRIRPAKKNHHFGRPGFQSAIIVLSGAQVFLESNLSTRRPLLLMGNMPYKSIYKRPGVKKRL